MSEWVKVATEQEVPEGGAKQVEVAGQAVALFRVAGSFHAIQNTCIHRGGPLAEGDLNGETVTCPWHMWEFDVTTGACKTAEGLSVDRYETKVENGDIFILPTP